jgi:hypothetical protein
MERTLFFAVALIVSACAPDRAATLREQYRQAPVKAVGSVGYRGVRWGTPLADAQKATGCTPNGADCVAQVQRYGQRVTEHYQFDAGGLRAVRVDLGPVTTFAAARDAMSQELGAPEWEGDSPDADEQKRRQAEKREAFAWVSGTARRTAEDELQTAELERKLAEKWVCASWTRVLLCRRNDDTSAVFRAP